MNYPQGPFAHNTYSAIRRAEQMQLLALQNIHSQFKTSRPKDLYEMTFEDHMEMLEREDREELNARYREMLVPLLEQVLQGGQ